VGITVKENDAGTIAFQNWALLKVIWMQNPGIMKNIHILVFSENSYTDGDPGFLKSLGWWLKGDMLRCDNVIQVLKSWVDDSYLHPPKKILSVKLIRRPLLPYARHVSQHNRPIGQ
jgi:hypothetical protein